MTITFYDKSDDKEKTFNADRINFNQYVQVCIAENSKTGKNFMCDINCLIRIT